MAPMTCESSGRRPIKAGSSNVCMRLPDPRRYRSSNISASTPSISSSDTGPGGPPRQARRPQSTLLVASRVGKLWLWSERTGCVLGLRELPDAAEFAYVLRRHFGAVQDDQVLVIVPGGASREIVRPEHDDTAIDDQHLIVHQPVLAVEPYIEPRF